MCCCKYWEAQEGGGVKRINVIISGDVQGVGFRAWARGVARKLGLVGWVKNREEGSVEVVAEGEKKELEKLIMDCHDGPDMAMVEMVDVTWEEPTDEFVGFEVVY